MLREKINKTLGVKYKKHYGIQISSSWPPLRNLWKFTKWKLDCVPHCPISCFQPDDKPMFGTGVQRDVIGDLSTDLQGRNQLLPRSPPSQLLIRSTTIKCGSVGSRQVWVNRANIANNHQLPIRRNGQASANRACHPWKTGTQRLDLAVPAFEMSLELSI